MKSSLLNCLLAIRIENYQGIIFDVFTFFLGYVLSLHLWRSVLVVLKLVAVGIVQY